MFFNIVLIVGSVLAALLALRYFLVLYALPRAYTLWALTYAGYKDPQSRKEFKRKASPREYINALYYGVTRAMPELLSQRAGLCAGQIRLLYPEADTSFLDECPAMLAQYVAACQDGPLVRKEAEHEMVPFYIYIGAISRASQCPSQLRKKLKQLGNGVNTWTATARYMIPYLQRKREALY